MTLARRLLWVAVMGTAFAGCTPVFVTATPRAVPASTANSPSNGYLRINVTSNLDAMKTPEFEKVAAGHKYLSVSVGFQGGHPAPEDSEYPLILYDLETRQMHTVSGVQVSRGQYMDFNSAYQTAMKLSIRAIPKTIATAYSDAFDSLQTLSAGLPLQELVVGNPYVAIAGKMLKNIADEANKDNEQTMTTAMLGINGGPANASVLPLDGTPVIVFLQRTDSAESPPAAKDLVLCQNNPGTVCVNTGGTQREYKANPYLIVMASTTDYRPTEDWAGTHWSCALAAQGTELARVEQALVRTRFTQEQEPYEENMLARVQLLARAKSLPQAFDLANADNLKTYADIVNSARGIGAAQSGSLWAARYAAQALQLDTCFAQEMEARSPQHRTAHKVIQRAFSAIDEFRAVDQFGSPLPDQARGDLYRWIDQATEPIRFLKLTAGDTYAILRSEQDAMERPLLSEDIELCNAIQEAMRSKKALGSLITELQHRLLSPCESCRAELLKTFAEYNVAQANASKNDALLALQAVEQARADLADAQSRANQLAQLAVGLGRPHSAGAIAPSTASVALVSSSSAKVEELRNATSDLSERTRSAERSLDLSQ